VISGQTAAGHNAVDMGMRLEGLSPGVQNGKQSNLSTEVLRVGCNFEQCGGAARKQKREQPPLILPHQRHERVRHAEDQVEVADRQQFLLTLVEPLVASVGLALGTVPVAARVVGDDLMTAARALIAMATERGGAAPCNGIEHLDLRPGQGLAIAFAESAACLADYIGHLKGWPTHPRRSSSAVRSVS
jgi:hypothetical protein